MTKPAIAFIGAGNMAAALIHGLIEDGYPEERITAADPDARKLEALRRHRAIGTTTNNHEAAANADLVVMAVKPQVLRPVLEDLAPTIARRRPLVLSIAAGITIATLRTWLGGDAAVVRTMPNTPAMVQTGATALVAGDGVSDEQKNNAEMLMRAVGLALWLDDENQLDAVTALSGSGPAYLFLVMEAMADAGQKLGLPKDTAQLLTLQTALGAARMAMESNDDLATLRARVTSPGGTTERAIQTLDAGGLRDLFATALGNARDRAIELSRELGDAHPGSA